MKHTIKIATRGSQLALIQSNFVKKWIETHNTQLTVELKIIKTTGDKILDSPLSKVGEKGLFVKEIEESLLDKETDIAVHSMKDVPTVLPQDLHIIAIGEREDPRDVLISNSYDSILKLPSGAKIGTSSLRRQVQLLNRLPSLNIVDIRGNLNTRLNKLESEKLDGIILAAAGVKRMGWESRITEVIPHNVCIPAVGQGAIGIESRVDNDYVNSIMKMFNHSLTHTCIIAERSMMRRLEGGCQVPIGGYAYMENENIMLTAMVASLDGKIMYTNKISGTSSEAENLGIKLAETLLFMGADKILNDIRGLQS
ncbi:MAG: hydroxymethylbilane synthase [Spirochaetota bacterium]|nr:hydroxymethylbilane synthase [Spirochaetota bacterium]